MNLFKRWLQYVQSPSEPSVERRVAEARLPFELKVECRQGNREFVGLIRQISAHGMRLDVSVPLKPEDTLLIQSFDTPRQHVLGRVAWVQGRHPEWAVGIQFNPSDENVFQGWLERAQANRPA